MTMTEKPPPEAGMDWKRFAGPLSALAGLVGILIAIGVITTIARSADDADNTGLISDGDSVIVEPDFTLSPLNINVSLSEDGIEPEIIFIPAGRPIRLVLTNRGLAEHHFRIKGLVPIELLWMVFPEIDEYEIASMSPEDLVAYGFEEAATITDAAELEHFAHHLMPQMMPTKAESPSGIKPLATEVHGYVARGGLDVMEFVVLKTGEYEAEDVRFPEFTARVIVFAATG